MKIITLLAIISVMVIMGAINVNGRTITWVGKIQEPFNDWNLASNWDAAVVPTSNDDVVVKFPNTTSKSSLWIRNQAAHANTLTLSHVDVVVFAPLTVDKVVSVSSEIRVFPDGSPSVFGQVVVDTFDLASTGSSANVTSLIATDLFLFISTKLTVSAKSTIGTIYLVNGGIYGKTNVDAKEVFVDAENITAQPIPDVYRSRKQFYAKAVEQRQKTHQRKLHNQQTASTFSPSLAKIDANLDAVPSVVPGIISQVHIQADRFVLVNGDDYPVVLLFEHLGTISTF